MLSKKNKNYNQIIELSLALDNTEEEIKSLAQEINAQDDNLVYIPIQFPYISLPERNFSKPIHYKKFNQMIVFIEVLLDLTLHLKSNNITLQSLNDSDHYQLEKIYEYLENELIDPDILLLEKNDNNPDNYLNYLNYKLAYLTVLLSVVIPDIERHMETLTKKVNDFIQYHQDLESL